MEVSLPFSTDAFGFHHPTSHLKGLVLLSLLLNSPEQDKRSVSVNISLSFGQSVVESGFPSHVNVCRGDK